MATRRSGGLAGAPYSLLISSTRVTVLRIVMMCSLFWCLSVPGRYYRFKSAGQRVGALDVRVGSRGEVTACPLCSWKRTSPGTRETSVLGQVQIVILRVLHILVLSRSRVMKAICSAVKPKSLAGLGTENIRQEMIGLWSEDRQDSLVSGARVCARYPDSQLYLGRITAAGGSSKNAIYSVRFDDGDRDRLRRHELQSAGDFISQYFNSRP